MGDWDSHIHTAVYKIDNNSTQYSVMAYMGKESKKEKVNLLYKVYLLHNICICITDSLCCISEINATL